MLKHSKVLLIQTAFLGDAVLATALLEKIRMESPDTEIHILVRKGNESLFKAYPYTNLKTVWSYDKSRKWSSWLELRRDLSKEHFDAVYVIQRFLGMGLLSLCIGAKRVFGFDKNPMSLFFTEKVRHEWGTGIHEVERNTALVKSWLGEKVFKPYLRTPKIDLATEMQKKEYICISPGSVWETKRLPIRIWIEFIQLLPENQVVVLMGSPGEIELSDQIAAAFQGSNRIVLNETGKHPLLASAYIFQQSKMSFVNDSGPMHICSAENVPTVAVYCSTVPSFGFGPLADWNRIVETKHVLDCRPCGDHGKKNCPLGHYACGEGIEAKSLLQAYQDYLSSGC
ncbi:glycosyltransferase family 9 protein [Aquirufa aurantiipilula]|uniref:Glycosyltransferase family 9 protein n=1 Tax=Aquirufa aurantiipilula TaxID=2696561 RepID=A0ABT6BLV9_9BACT|nr:glycosyltransferase family 9 protein [Aquirufa aurantiipilula]MDF5691170.1 glycosyltransferase family 9 protein [Aquirufa aurantiipilula]